MMNEKTRKMALIAMLGAMSFVLMMFEIPLWFVPPFYEIDLSEVPVMIGAFALGPIAGVAIEVVKLALELAVRGTSTGFIGEGANLVIGCMYVLPAALIYHRKKTKKNAIIGLIAGSVFMCVAGCFVNAYILVPAYSKFFMPMEAIIGAGTKVNGFIKDLPTFIMFGVLPFNAIKSILVSLITLMLYKYVRRILK